MKSQRTFSFSLLTIFLVTVIAALCASHVAMMRRVKQARQDVATAQADVAAAQAEVAAVRKQFGYIKVADPKLLHISRIEAGENSANRYRLIVPSGCHYMLHITDTSDYPARGFPVDPQPTKSMSMNSWRQGADLILHWNVARDADGTPRLVAATDSEELFNYRVEGWTQTSYPNSGWHLDTKSQQAFKPDETICFMTCSNDKTKRGVMLWMEPAAQWYKRRGETVPDGS